MLKRTHKIADGLIDAQVLTADDFLDMDDNDPEWYVALHVRKLAFILWVKRWYARVTTKRSREAH